MAKIICIDPGHGGKDPGGGTNKHFKEKDMVLKISFEQKKHFERNGIKVVMTRTGDEYLDSVPRTTRVKNSGAKYCISNHINAGGGEGAETIHSIHGSAQIATGILNALVAAGAKKRRVFSRRGVSGDYYYMHRMTGAVDTIIVEYGFADNASDTQKIINEWKKYAEVVARYYIEKVFKQKYISAGEKKVNAPKTEVGSVKVEAPKKPSGAYKGGSIVDYLNSIGVDSSKESRKKLAKQYGVSGYDFSADKNLELLNKMRGVKPASKPAAKPKPQPKGTVHLPASAKTWRTYKLNVKPVKKNSDWSLTPAAFGGLTYKILGRPYPDVVTINTGRGKRNIYVGPETGAVIK